MSAQHSSVRQPGTAPVPVLLYHSIHDRPLGEFGPFTVGRDQFIGHLDRLTALGVRVLSLTELLAHRTTGAALPARSVVITFDDGFADFADHAWPELHRRGLPVTLYVTAGTVGGRSVWLAPVGAQATPMLTSGQLRELADAGCDIGAHSMTHPELDCLDVDRARAEIRQSKDVLEQLLQRPVPGFAYPHGYHDRAVKRLVTEAGFAHAAAVRNALSPVDDDPFALARVTVMADDDADRIERIVLGQGVPTAQPRERLRTVVWRQVRRVRGRSASRATELAAR
jgi:peptidoglycan/xylan/chitin deacetylase (PgdA/CDA1 family)